MNSSQSRIDKAHCTRFSAAETATTCWPLRPLAETESLQPPNAAEAVFTFQSKAENHKPFPYQVRTSLSAPDTNFFPYPYTPSSASKIRASFKPDGIVPLSSETDFKPAEFSIYTFPPAALSRLTPRNIWADTGLIADFSASFLTHGALFIILFVHFGAKPTGAEQESDIPQMQMIFAPPSLNSMKGERVKEQGGGGTPPPPTAAPQPNPTPAKTPVAPPVPPEELSETGEIAAPNPKEKQAEKKPSPTKTNAKANANASKISSSKSANNPFANLTDVSFDGDPSTARHVKGKKGGNKGAIDMSMGPLSTNGKINAPYSSSNTIKGVSSDYGALLDEWIRNHIFYPDDAVRQELEGATSVHVRLDRKGHVLGVRISGPSGVSSLDMATVSIFQGQKLPDIPEDMDKNKDHFDIDVQVNYLLIRH